MTDSPADSTIRLGVTLAVAAASAAFVGFSGYLVATGTPARPALVVALLFASTGIALCFGGAAWWLPRLRGQASLVRSCFRSQAAERDCGSVFADTVGRLSRPWCVIPAGAVFSVVVTLVLHRQLQGQSADFVPAAIAPAWLALVAVSAFGIGVGHMLMAVGLSALVAAAWRCTVAIDALPRLRRLARFYARLTLYLLLVYANYVGYLIATYFGGVALSGAVVAVTLLVGAGILAFLLVPQIVIRDRLVAAKEQLMARVLDEMTPADDDTIEAALLRHARLQNIESLPEWAVDWGRVTVVLNAYLTPSAALVAVAEPLRHVFG
jgi:hypothetical protein